MAQVLIDTSALIAFFVQSEKHHLAVKNYVLENPTV
jgi:predicted nucleic acid-binding protein